MKITRFILLTLFAILFYFNLSAQDYNAEADSLREALKNCKQDTSRVNILLKIGKIYAHKIPDTALVYYQKALEISKKKNLKHEKAISLNKLGTYYFYTGDYDKAFKYYSEAVKLFKELGDKKREAKNIKNMGVVCSLKSENKKALNYYNESLRIYEEINDTLGIAKNLLNIGSLYSTLSVFDKALQYFQKSFKVFTETGSKYGMSLTLGNAADVFVSRSDYDKALEYYQKALQISKDAGNIREEARYLGNIAYVYIIKKKYDKALENINKSLKIHTKLKDKVGISENLINTGIAYRELSDYRKASENLLKSLSLSRETGNKINEANALYETAKLYFKQKKYYKSLNYARQALKVAEYTESLENKKNIYTLLSDIYKNLKQYKKALEYRDSADVLRDSIFNEEKTKAIAEMQVRYETEKKEKQIIKQKAELKASRLQIEKEKIEKEKQKIIIRIFIFGILFAVILSAIMFRMYKQKKTANIKLRQHEKELKEINDELTASEEELKQQNEILCQRNEEIEAQRDKIKESKAEIEAVYKNITDNINYARTIQRTLLTSEEDISICLPGHFVLYIPKDRVSGDFYYVKKQKENIIFAAADCTGHGVSGAFLTVLGITYLNGIIAQKQVTDPGEILNELRIKVKETFKTFDNGSSHGIDMALCSLNTKTNELKYSGAYNPAWIFRNGELIELTAQRNPVGFFYKEVDFVSKKIKLQKNDMIYLFSDGFIDQIGEKTKKKFTKKRFRELLTEINELPLNKQKEKLNTVLAEWKGNEAQTDDITVMGVKNI
ncbi:MAG: tetratricopeptide repeat protein [Chlorobi bacterium]|nr:tetratricopeptide repeat protein [Chlorobiota bacterium]